MPALVCTRSGHSVKLVVFATDDTAMLALLSSAPHYWWAVSRASSMKADLRYTPSDVFETFPLPELTADMRQLGDRLDTYRRSVMLARQTGLTKTYNLVFDPTVHDEDIVELRRIHEAIDRATITAYGWDDLLDRLDHGFHPAGRDLRYTIGPWAQREILDRLLELNHERYAEEVAKGLHDKKKARTARAPKTSRRRGPVLMPPSPRRCEIRSGKMRQRFSPRSALRVDPCGRDELRQPVADLADPLRGVDLPVVDPAQHGQVRQLRLAAALPGHDVVALAPRQLPVAPGMRAAAVAGGDRPAQPVGDRPGRPADVQGLTGSRP